MAVPEPDQPVQFIGYLFERVQKLEDKVRELERWKAEAMAWANTQREFHQDNVNEAGQFFDVFGTE